MNRSDMTFTITVEQMAFFTNAVVERDRLRREMRDATDALTRKKEALRRYQAICEKAKALRDPCVAESGPDGGDRAASDAAQDGKIAVREHSGKVVMVDAVDLKSCDDAYYRAVRSIAISNNKILKQIIARFGISLIGVGGEDLSIPDLLDYNNKMLNAIHSRIELASAPGVDRAISGAAQDGKEAAR